MHFRGELKTIAWRLLRAYISNVCIFNISCSIRPLKHHLLTFSYIMSLSIMNMHLAVVSWSLAVIVAHSHSPTTCTLDWLVILHQTLVCGSFLLVFILEWLCDGLLMCPGCIPDASWETLKPFQRNVYLNPCLSHFNKPIGEIKFQKLNTKNVVSCNEKKSLFRINKSLLKSASGHSQIWFHCFPAITSHPSIRT